MSKDYVAEHFLPLVTEADGDELLRREADDPDLEHTIREIAQRNPVLYRILELSFYFDTDMDKEGEAYKNRLRAAAKAIFLLEKAAVRNTTIA